VAPALDAAAIEASSNGGVRRPGSAVG